MFLNGSVRKVGGAPNVKAPSAVFARFAVRVQSGKAMAVPLWRSADGGGGSVPGNGGAQRDCVSDPSWVELWTEERRGFLQ